MRIKVGCQLIGISLITLASQMTVAAVNPIPTGTEQSVQEKTQHAKHVKDKNKNAKVRHKKASSKYRKLEKRLAKLEKKQKKFIRNLPKDPVLALPQEKFRPKYNTASIYNQDLKMLQMRQKYDREMKKKHYKPMPYPHIELGGSVIGAANTGTSPYVAPLFGRTQNDINLTGANLDVNTEVLPFILTNMRISYTPSAPERVAVDTLIQRVSNSNIYLNTAFFTLGDLNHFPLYLSMGQMYLPFGDYGSELLTAPVTARLGRSQLRPILLGYQPQSLPGFNASIFAFKGDAYEENQSGIVNNWGSNLTYTLTQLPLIEVTAGASYIHNIADSGGMQNVGASSIVSDAGYDIDNSYLDDEELDDDDEPFVPVPATRFFRGFGASDLEKLIHRVPAVDFRTRIKLNKIPLAFYGEYVGTTRAFAARNASFNTDYDGDPDTLVGARPAAWNVEGSWSFTLLKVPSALIVGYGKSYDALLFNTPNKTYGLTLRGKFNSAISGGLGLIRSIAYPLNSYAEGQTLMSKGNKFVGTNTTTALAQIVVKY